MISTTSTILLVLFLIINSGLLYYFVKKYQETQLITSLYWVLTYLFFIIAIVASLIVGLADGTLEEAVSIQVPFVILGLTTLGLSAISTGIFSDESRIYELLFGIVGLIGFFMYFTGQESISTVIFIVLAFFSVVVYFYLAYTGSNYRIAIISVGLLLQAVSGRLSVSDIISTNFQLVLNSIGQIAIAIGLLGIGLKTRE